MKLPYARVNLTKEGKIADPRQVAEALAMIEREQATDVVVISHGWNNDLAAAERLYTTLMDNVAAKQPAGSAAKVVVIGVLWPSLQWAAAGQAVGGGASVGDDAPDLAAAIRDSVEDPALAAELDALVDGLETAAGRAAFLDRARTLLDRLPAPGVDDEDAPPSPLRSGDAEAVFDAVRTAVAGLGTGLPLAGPGAPGAGEADAGAGAGPGADEGAGEGAPGVAPDLLAGPAVGGSSGGAAGGSAGGSGGESGGGAARAADAAGLLGISWPKLGQDVLNLMTYYTMKARAGDVGANGVAPLVDQINAAHPDARIHLVGHSFGARVVSAAATNIRTPIESLTLLQGAFSHYGFTKDYRGSGKDGAFRGAIANGRIHGPVVITHTHNDTAVGRNYAIVSRLAGQVGAALGDRDDPYGGIGANGSVGSGATELELLDADGTYQLQAGAIHNLLADRTIADHGDVTNAAVANAVAHAIGLV